VKKIAPTRLLLPIILTALGGIIMLLAAALWVIQNSSSTAEQYQLRDGHLIAEGLANAVAPEMVSRDYGALEGRLLQTASDPNVRSVLVIDMQGQVLGYVHGRLPDAPAHPVFDLHKILPPHAEHMLKEVHPDFLSVWHIIKVGIDVGWVRVDIATDYYAQNINKVKREVWVLALAVTIAGFLLLAAAIFHSNKLLRQHDTEVENHQQFLEDKAYYDALTRLPNRSLLHDRLTQAVARNSRNQRLLAVCFVDLDDFKPINDTFGHDAGDRVLIEVARRLQSSVRGDDTVARLGGDEFVVLLGEMENPQEAKLSVNRLLISLSEPLITGGKKINLHASIGYALHPNDSKDVESLLNLSDQAMYQAKTSGGNSVRRYLASPD
jgi:diguanylate cyclase (GGDEF)-like protein